MSVAGWVVSMCSNYRKSTRNASLVATVESRFVSDLVFSGRGQAEYGDGDSIAIVGGELFNKGAQAMTFTVVDQMTKRYPKKDVYLLSGRDYERNHKEKEQYDFEILPWGPEVQLSLLSPGLDVVNTNQFSKRDLEKVRSVFADCGMLIDINGFRLSSQIGSNGSFTYLVNILLAKEYDIPMYILPQSIGPFDYPTKVKPLLNPLMQMYLPYPEVVCPREHAGVDALAPYTRSNVQREFDIVLQTEGYNLNNIYATEPGFEYKELKSDAVGIVPNSKVFDRTDDEAVYSLYEEAIDELFNADKTVYVFRHSVEDLDHCRNIKDRFSGIDSVQLFEEDFDAPELEHIIEQCDFLIASRYHSIVHAYKHAVPVVAIGWAVKYKELLNKFEQSAYFFEGREQIDSSAFVGAVDRISEQWENESEIIKNNLNKITEKNLFDGILPNPLS